MVPENIHMHQTEGQGGWGSQKPKIMFKGKFETNFFSGIVGVGRGGEGSKLGRDRDIFGNSIVGDYSLVVKAKRRNRLIAST